jgi:hypothetical protein
VISARGEGDTMNKRRKPDWDKWEKKRKIRIKQLNKESTWCPLFRKFINYEYCCNVGKVISDLLNPEALDEFIDIDIARVVCRECVEAENKAD